MSDVLELPWTEGREQVSPREYVEACLNAIDVRDGDLQSPLQSACRMHELRAAGSKRRGRRFVGRMSGRRPQGAIVLVPNQQVRAPRIARHVFAPARQGYIVPAAESGAARAQHGAVCTIRKEACATCGTCGSHR